MADSLIHRGPDDRGTWGDPAAGVFLGHRRLSILDLSPLGHQPMQSPDGRWTIAFNGEIYNFLALRKELERAGHVFRGQSDTEVLLALIGSHGLKRALRAARGMFALAVWDGGERTLYLARDRMGEKPLYCGWIAHSFVFASELRALFAHEDWSGHIDRDALASYLRYNAVPGSMSIFQGIRKLEPGRVLALPAGQREPRIESYWDPQEEFSYARSESWADSDETFLESLDELLMSAVRDQMVSDVPLGAFLSGGVDSSLVVALMQSQSARPVRTFTIGFAEAEFDESRHAREVARRLGTDHTEAMLSGNDVLARVPRLPVCYDEPFADSSQLPTMMVSEVARRHVTVSLSGDGGDELFGGYSRYPQVLERWRRISARPAWLRHLGAGSVERLPDPVLQLLGRGMQKLRGSSLPPAGLADRVRAITRRWGTTGLADTYRRSVSFWDDPESIVVGGFDRFGLETGLAGSTLADSDPLTWMRYRDARIYLPDDILTKVDRAAMHVALETRVPLLDHRVVELAWRAPEALCYRDGRGKWPLRALLARYLPEELINRPKMGFAVPLNDWLRGPLREWAGELLEPGRLAREGWFRPEPIQRRWRDLQAGGDGHELALWSILMFQAWREHWASHIAA
jgi:asparagine synthase (glutamine-hydrolysing)